MTTPFVKVRLPGGRAGELEDVLTSLDDGNCWVDPSTEMYVSRRVGNKHAMLTVIRREQAGVCLVFRETDEGEWISFGDPREGSFRLELLDVTVHYPAKFFVDLGSARRAVVAFLASFTRSQDVSWKPVAPGDIMFEPYAGES